MHIRRFHAPNEQHSRSTAYLKWSATISAWAVVSSGSSFSAGARLNICKQQVTTSWNRDGTLRELTVLHSAHRDAGLLCGVSVLNVDFVQRFDVV